MADATKQERPFPAPRPESSVRGPQPDALNLAGLLDGWMQGDAAEQQETFETLRRSLDENRPEGYKLFP